MLLRRRGSRVKVVHLHDELEIPSWQQMDESYWEVHKRPMRDVRQARDRDWDLGAAYGEERIEHSRSTTCIWHLIWAELQCNGY